MSTDDFTISTFLFPNYLKYYYKLQNYGTVNVMVGKGLDLVMK